MDLMQKLFWIQLDSIEVKFTDAPDTPEKSREDCAPGQPHVNFIAEAGVVVHFVNPTARNGLFSVSASLVDGDTVEKVKAKIAKDVKAIKGNRHLKNNHLSANNIFLMQTMISFSDLKWYYIYK